MMYPDPDDDDRDPVDFVKSLQPPRRTERRWRRAQRKVDEDSRTPDDPI